MRDVFEAAVLIVDDQAANVKLLERLLKKAGYTNVTGVTDPLAVLPIFESAPPDILLLDLNMPLLGGFEILRQLQPWVAASGDDYLPVLILTADTTSKARERSLAAGGRDFLTKPFDHIEVQQRIKNLLETRRLHLMLRDHNLLLEERVRARTEELRGTVNQLEIAQLKLVASEAETVTRLSIAAEFRDDETARHILRMSRYCALLAQKAGEPEERCERILLASRMHDIGKIGTPDHILLKPGPLTDDERKIIQEHAEIGYKILAGSESELLQIAATIALTHHERPDGTGYPRGLHERDIPRVGRIAAIADVFDALTTDRVYRKAMPLEKALSIMEEGRGSQFDSALLTIFIEAMPELLAIKANLDETGTSLTQRQSVDPLLKGMGWWQKEEFDMDSGSHSNGSTPVPSSS